jgi:hypothetical protein
MRNLVLAAIGLAALLVSPATAQSARTPTPSNSTVPTDARGSVDPYVAHEGGPYRPSMPGAWGRGRRYPEMRQTIY